VVCCGCVLECRPAVQQQRWCQPPCHLHQSLFYILLREHQNHGCVGGWGGASAHLSPPNLGCGCMQVGRGCLGNVSLGASTNVMWRYCGSWSGRIRKDLHLHANCGRAYANMGGFLEMWFCDLWITQWYKGGPPHLHLISNLLSSDIKMLHLISKCSTSHEHMMTSRDT
jgi:hypothetical protein